MGLEINVELHQGVLHFLFFFRIYCIFGFEIVELLRIDLEILLCLDYFCKYILMFVLIY